MCGIAGCIDSTERDLETAASRMIDRLAHRGPDDAGIWVDRGVGIALGHRRLSVLDLSSAGQQPMISSCGRYVIVYNGEIYNVEELRRVLDGKRGEGTGWSGHSDTEVLLAAIRQWGVEATLGRLVGMFAFAVWDRHLRILTLARDRMGEKPLYYGWAGKAFLFGSELKGLTAYPSWAGNISLDALGLFLRFGNVPAPFSIYRGVYKLLPGAIRTVRPGEPQPSEMDRQVQKYWSISDAIDKPFAGSATEAVDCLHHLLTDSVRRQMVADVPLGAFLSGGIDSSTVATLMQAAGTRPVKTFTIGFQVPDYNESEFAKTVATHLGTEHTELQVTPEDAMGVIPLLPTLYDEPFADSSQIPTFLLSKLTRDYVTVSLSGDGGDELFGGYNRYALVEKIWRLVGWLPQSARAALAWFLGRVPMTTLDHGSRWLDPVATRFGRKGKAGEKVRKLAGLIGAPSVESLYLSLLSSWREPSLLLANGAGDTLPAWAREATAGGGLLDYMTRLDLAGYLPDDILVKVDRAAMSVSLETRLPLLDHRVVEFALNLPAEFKVRNGQGKWILRQVLHRYLPEELFRRPKRGFAVPLGSWLRGPLREWAEELLSPERLRADGFFHPEPIRRQWTEHLAGHFDWQSPLWCILMFQCWLADQKTRAQAPSSFPLAARTVAASI